MDWKGFSLNILGLVEETRQFKTKAEHSWVRRHTPVIPGLGTGAQKGNSRQSGLKTNQAKTTETQKRKTINCTVILLLGGCLLYAFVFL